MLVTTTKANLRMLHTAVNKFRMDTDSYLIDDEGLKVLIREPSNGVKNGNCVVDLIDFALDAIYWLQENNFK